MKILELDKILEGKGLSFLDIIEKVVNDRELAKKIYKREKKLNVRLLEIIRRLKEIGWKIIIVTKNKRVKKLIEKYGLSALVDDVIVVKKPYRYCADVYIGNDDYEDILPGLSVNAITIKINELPDFSMFFNEDVKDLFVNNEIYDFLAEEYLGYHIRNLDIVKQKLDFLIKIFSKYNVTKEKRYWILVVALECMLNRCLNSDIMCGHMIYLKECLMWQVDLELE